METPSPKTRDLRTFGGALAVLLGLIAFWRRGADGAFSAGAIAAAALSLGCAAVTVAAPQALRRIYGPWMRVGAAIGAVMTRVILTVIYFTILVPFTLIRLSDPLRKRRGPRLDTYWEPYRNPEATLERYERPF